MNFTTNYSRKMKIRTAVIALIAISAAILTSCIENDRQLGNSIIPEDQIVTVHTKSFDIDVKNRLSDSVQSVSYSHILVGDLHHPVFGTVRSGGASYIMPYTESKSLGVGPKLIKAYLTLNVSSTYCTNDSQEGIHQRLRIYELLEPIDSTMSTCESLTPDKFSEETITGNTPIIYGKGSVKIPLKDSFAEKLLATTDEEFEDMDLFLKRINGFYITSDPIPDNGREGGRLNFLNLGSSKITVEYTMNDPEQKIENADTTITFAFGYSYAFNFFAPGSKALENENPTDKLYIESLNGIKPHIKAETLKQMLDKWVMEDEELHNSSIILSRAELVFPFEMPEDYTRIEKEFPQMIYAFRNNRTGNGNDTTVQYYTPLEEIYHHYNIGGINRSLKQYSMDITDYIQDLLLTDDIDSQPDLWIAPMYSRSNPYGNSYYYFDNRAYSRAILNGPTAERKPTLKLTFGTMSGME